MVENGGVTMRDFPIFTTEYGVSSLFLKEIPYKKQAHIRIRGVQEGFFAEHLQECVSFCRMAGAERIFAADHEALEKYPLYVTVYEMRGTAHTDPEKLANLFPVTQDTVGQWRRIYNERMAGVDNAGTLEARDEVKIMQGESYFIHRNGKLMGIGWIEDGKLLAVASVEKGAGETVMHTLMSLLEGQAMTLEVASTNEKAIRLYEKLGFIKTAEKTRWYEL